MGDFNFSDTVKDQARLRQSHYEVTYCAHCGCNLNDIEDRAHHVVPNQTGVKGCPEHAFLGMAVNCVYLCLTCHDRVHGNADFRNGAVAPATYFPFSHGVNKHAHKQWVTEITKLENILWKYKRLDAVNV